MLRFLALCVTVFFSDIAHAQQDTFFYDINWQPLPSKTGAAYYRLLPVIEDGRYKVLDYHADNKPRMIGYYDTAFTAPADFEYTLMGRTEQGYFQYFDSTGKKTEEGNYLNGHREGSWKEYYNNGVLHAELNYRNDSLNGNLKSYYRNKKLKRKAVYAMGVRKEGTMYDAAGKKIPYTDYRVMPQPGYDINDYMGKTIIYPPTAQENNVEGKTAVRFVVNSKGYITKCVIVKSAHPLLDAEALRVVSSLPPWKPGLVDDKPESFYYTMPVTFRLED